ncbi:MAG: hypothetical protein Q9173_000053 [Seirophora scorigena]
MITSAILELFRNLLQEAIDRAMSASAIQIVVFLVFLWQLRSVLSRGNLFSIPAVRKYVVFLSTPEQVDEVSKAPIDQLSFNAAIDEQFLPQLIFHGFEFDPKDPRFSVPLHAMKTDLRDHLQSLIPSLLRALERAFQTELPDDKCANEWMEISPHGICQHIVETLNCVVMVGEDIASDPAFLKSTMQYTQDIVITGEVLRFCPPTLQL